MNIKSIKPVIDGAILLILKYCRKLKIAEYINDKINFDKERLLVHLELLLKPLLLMF